MKECRKYRDEMLGLFADQELEPPLHDQVAKHLKSCEACSSYVESVHNFSYAYTSFIKDEVSSAEISIEQSRRMKPEIRSGLSLSKLLNPVFFKRICLPVISFVAIILVSVNVFNFNMAGLLDPGVEPSAIVDSVDGEVSSVMIFETARDHQTVIWFKEVI